MPTFYATIDADSDSLTLHAYMPKVPMLLSAASWSRVSFRPPRIPEHIPELAADCGGFVAARRWGGYRFTLPQYVGWLRTFPPCLTWAATMDYPCEPPLTGGDPLAVARRQIMTTLRGWQAWANYKAVPWSWVPTIQGWEVADYARHAHQIRPLVDSMARHYGDAYPSSWRVGIGTLCARADVPMIIAVVKAVSQELPGVPLHLWGVKLNTFKSPATVPASVVSFDSAAWNGLFGKDLELWRASGLRQRVYTYSVMLPRYLDRLRVALNNTR